MAPAPRESSNTHLTTTPALRPMTASEYAEWLVESIPAYAQDKVSSGQWSAEESLEQSRREHDELLPQGLETPDNHFFAIVDARSVAVGMLWFAVTTKFNARIAYVYDVSVRPERQREGHAKRAFLALEDEVQRLGLGGIALHVFGHNAGARALYAGLGYQPTNINLFKSLGAAAAR
jgi:ribosomal protein S18 acetylase RimI-like enzyme